MRLLLSRPNLLKAKASVPFPILKYSTATINKYKNTESAKPATSSEKIPAPKGKYNLQEAIGLDDRKELYNACRVSFERSLHIKSNW